MTEQPVMVEVFGTEPTVADIARKLSKPQRRFLEYGVMFNREGSCQLQKALERKGLVQWNLRLTRLGEAVKAHIDEQAAIERGDHHKEGQ